MKKMGRNKDMSWKHLTKESRQKIKKLYATGWRQIDIAKEFGIAQSGVSRICSKSS